MQKKKKLYKEKKEENKLSTLNQSLIEHVGNYYDE